MVQIRQGGPLYSSSLFPLYLMLPYPFASIYPSVSPLLAVVEADSQNITQVRILNLLTLIFSHPRPSSHFPCLRHGLSLSFVSFILLSSCEYRFSHHTWRYTCDFLLLVLLLIRLFSPQKIVARLV